MDMFKRNITRSNHVTRNEAVKEIFESVKAEKEMMDEIIALADEIIKDAKESGVTEKELEELQNSVDSMKESINMLNTSLQNKLQLFIENGASKLINLDEYKDIIDSIINV